MTMTERTAVVGVFTDRTHADRAIEDLHNAGFTDDQIGYVVRNAQTGETENTIAPDDQHDTAAGAAAGAIGGGVVGGVLGAAAALLIPGLGPAIAGGVLAATLGGAALGAVAGGLVGALTGMGVPEEEANYYQTEFESGRTIVTVRTEGQRYQEALNILRTNGAYDATSRPESTTTTADYNTTTSATNVNTVAGTTAGTTYDQDVTGARSTASTYDTTAGTSQYAGSTGSTVADEGRYTPGTPVQGPRNTDQ